MKCKGIFVFKSITHRDAGKFKNDKGDEISFPASYTIKVDEINDDGDITERKFKFADSEKQLANSFSQLSAYDKIEIEFDVTIYATSVALRPVSFELM